MKPITSDYQLDAYCDGVAAEIAAATPSRDWLSVASARASQSFLRHAMAHLLCQACDTTRGTARFWRVRGSAALDYDALAVAIAQSEIQERLAERLERLGPLGN